MTRGRARLSAALPALECYVSADKAHGQSPAIYGAVFRSAGRTVLEYWLFYPFDLYTFANPLGSVWQDHEGDSEAVVVVLDKTSNRSGRGEAITAPGRNVLGRGAEQVRLRPSSTLRSLARELLRPALRRSRVAAFHPGASALGHYGSPSSDEAGKGRKIAQATISPVTAETPASMTFAWTVGRGSVRPDPNQQPTAYGSAPPGRPFHSLSRRPARRRHLRALAVEAVCRSLHPPPVPPESLHVTIDFRPAR